MGPEVAWLRSGRSRRRRGSKDELPRAETPKPGARPTAHANPRPRAQQSARARRGEGPGCWVSIQSTGQQTCKEETASPGWGSAPGQTLCPERVPAVPAARGQTLGHHDGPVLSSSLRVTHQALPAPGNRQPSALFLTRSLPVHVVLVSVEVFSVGPSPSFPGPHPGITPCALSRNILSRVSLCPPRKRFSAF